jgi:hypothetical protein
VLVYALSLIEAVVGTTLIGLSPWMLMFLTICLRAWRAVAGTTPAEMTPRSGPPEHPDNYSYRAFWSDLSGV